MEKRRFLSLAAKLALLCTLITATLGSGLIFAWSNRRGDLIRLAGGNPVSAAVFLIAGAAIVTGLVTYWCFDRYIERPVEVLNETAARITGGDIGFRARVTGPKEFAGLAAGFNRMIDSVVNTQSKADMDALTGLFNYRHARNYLRTQIGLAERYNRHLTIAMVDIDHFQEVNDLYGHPAGDEVLKSAADYIKTQLRQVDYLARCGGEEFLIVLPETAAAPAMMVMERIHAGFSGHVFIKRGESKSPVFMSAGVADFPRSGEDATNLMAAANMALILAKRRGRNQVAYFRALDRKAG